MPLTSGDRLGPYQIISLIGKGGMGEVYRAHDSRLNRDVAIKVSSAQFTERFTREAHAIAALNHANICHLYDVGPNYLVMELVEGPTLAERIKEGAILLEESLGIARQIGNALEAAHEKGIVHRDLKPGNVILKADGSVKVLDFGLAKVGPRAASGQQDAEHSPTISMAATQAGVILGTAAYMSPEQARGKTVDKRADIWAFGVVLYEMVTGQRLFEGEDLTETLASVVMKEPDLSEAPERVRRVLARCLVKDPNKRLRDVSSVELLLEQAPPVAAETKVVEKASKWPWAVATAGLAAAVVTGFLYMRQPEAAKLEVMRFEMQAPDGAPFGEQMRISPDGRMIAFTATGGGDTRRRMWIRSLDSLKAKPLPGTEGTQDGMFWLPDSRMLVFQLGGKLRKIDVTGGPAQPICDFSSSVGGGFLTADNQIVFGTPATLGIQSCPAGGGVAKSVTAFKPGGQEQFHAFPSLLPDSKHFLFWREAGANTGIYAGSLDVKPEEQTGKRILPDSSGTLFLPGADGGPGTLLFVREGTLMAQGFDAGKLELVGEATPVGENLRNQYAFSASKDGRLAYLNSGGNNTQLTWFDRQGMMLGTLGKPGPPYSGMRISPDGTRLAAGRREAGAQSDIWVVDLAQGSETRLTSDPASDSEPVWSPDGKRIAFSSNREGTNNVYVRAADGAGNDELLLKTGERKTPLDWSRDGKFLMFGVLSARSTDVWVLPMDAGQPGERKPAPYLHSNANERNARFSPDGRFVAYDSDESGLQEVYVRPFDSGSPEVSGSGAGKVKVSQNGGVGPQWGPGGKELLYYTPDRKVWSVDVTWTPEFRAAKPKLLGQVPDGNGTTTPDSQRLLIGVPLGGQQRSATVVLNWQAVLKK